MRPRPWTDLAVGRHGQPGLQLHLPDPRRHVAGLRRGELQVEGRRAAVRRALCKCVGGWGSINQPGREASRRPSRRTSCHSFRMKPQPKASSSARTTYRKGGLPGVGGWDGVRRRKARQFRSIERRPPPPHDSTPKPHTAAFEGCPHLLAVDQQAPGHRHGYRIGRSASLPPYVFRLRPPTAFVRITRLGVAGRTKAASRAERLRQALAVGDRSWRACVETVVGLKGSIEGCGGWT